MKKFSLFSNLKLSYKLSVAVLLAVVLALALYGGYLYLFLQKNHEKITKEAMAHAISKVESDLQTRLRGTTKGVDFVQNDETVLASLDLINRYGSQKLYNRVLIDEEKKLLLEQLLANLKLSGNDEAVLYDQNQELLAFIIKDSNDYIMHYLSYEAKQKVLFEKFAIGTEYRQKPFVTYPLIPMRHALYYDPAEVLKRPLVTFHALGDELLITSHKDIYDTVNKKVAGHVEISSVLSHNYFLNLSKDLHMRVRLSDDPLHAKEAVSVFEPYKTQNFKVRAVGDTFVSSMSFPTTDKVVSIVFELDRYDNSLDFSQNRADLVLLLLLLLFIIPAAVAYIFKKWLVGPMHHLMGQIEKIEKGDYTKSEVLKTDDELELISNNINKLAITLKRREKQLQTSQENFEHLSNHDPLTNLPNRRLFYEKLDKAIEHAKQKDTKIAVIFLDLDQFKHINDTLGHHIGDELLIEVGKRLRKQIRLSDSVARVGGDEFNILLEEIASLKEVETSAKKLLESFEKPFHCSLGEINTTLSIGISIYPDDSKDPGELIQYADLAMYKTKELGRDNYSFFSRELSQVIHERATIIDALKQALKSEDEFAIAYQPKISMQTGKVASVEALVRWHSKTLGFVSPDRFIYLAEETNLIIPLGKWVLEKACQDFQTLLAEGYKLDSLSVNVSAVQLKNSDMTATILDTLVQTQLPPQMLELEITESYISANEKSAIEVLQKFRDMGIALAIDDFGTGYSSMSYLHKLPVTKLKIDKSFVDELEEGGSGVAIVKAIIVLAKTFGLQITAEGVETKEQLDFLKEHGCDEIQGYYYSKPLALEDLKNFF